MRLNELLRCRQSRKFGETQILQQSGHGFSLDWLTAPATVRFRSDSTALANFDCEPRLTGIRF